MSLAVTLGASWAVGVDPYAADWDTPGSADMPILSASQVDTFRDCARKWAWRYLEGVKEPPAASQQLGTRVHKILEDWLDKGIPPNPMEVLVLPTRTGLKSYFPGQVAQAGLHLLPPPGIGKVEGAFSMDTRETEWRGFIDLHYLLGPDGKAWAPEPTLAQFPGHTLVITDHKTTSNFQWVKTKDVLRQDVQAVLYATAVMEAFHVPLVLVRWVYYRTTGQPEAKPVDLTITREDALAEWPRIDATAKEIQTLYQIRPRALDLPPSPDACERYGGCPHRERCNLTMEERISALMATETIPELLARKARERDAQAHGNPTAGFVPPASAPPPLPTPTQAPPVPTGPPAAPSGSNVSWPWWKPGDPLNAAQAVLQGNGSPVTTLAAGADQAPPYEMMGWYQVPINGPDHPFYRAGIPAGTLPAALLAPLAPAVPVPPPPAAEAGTINPPEAPRVPPAQPAEMPPVPPPPKNGSAAGQAEVQDDLTGLDRERLKAIAVGMGIINQSSRLQDKALQALIRDTRVRGGQPPPAASSPPPLPAQPAAPPLPQAAAPAVAGIPGYPPPVPQAANPVVGYATAPSVPFPPGGPTGSMTTVAVGPQPAPPPLPVQGPPAIMRWFKFAHLPANLQEVSEPFCMVADWVVQTIPDSAERAVALRKLLEAKDAAVRAAMPPE